MSEKAPLEILEDKIMKVVEMVKGLKKENAGLHEKNEELEEKVNLMEKRFNELRSRGLDEKSQEAVKEAENRVSTMIDALQELDLD